MSYMTKEEILKELDCLISLLEHNIQSSRKAANRIEELKNMINQIAKDAKPKLHLVKDK